MVVSDNNPFKCRLNHLKPIDILHGSILQLAAKQ